jgi:5-formyltetrahydrofolate cyclo-ligase
VNDIRRYIAELRKNLRPEEIEAGSARGTENLAAWLTRENPSKLGMIGIYRAFGPNQHGEADPSALMRVASLAKSHFAFPRVLDRFNSEMDFAVPIHETDWVTGVYGNPEPRPDLPPVDPNEFDVIVVPGVVFGLSGERIGQGAGYYDRYLVQASGALRVGFGFDFQLLAEPVPQNDWDARMDAVVTDLRTVETSIRSSL